MTFGEEKPKRRSIRLRGYDYSQAGAYFVTICCHRRKSLFGRVTSGKMRGNDVGETVMECWAAIPDHFAHVLLDEYVVMPNHMHGILIFREDVVRYLSPSSLVEQAGACKGAARCAHLPNNQEERVSTPRLTTLGSVIRAFKSAVTRTLRQEGYGIIGPIWQRNYYEHVIRDEIGLNRIRDYIQTNPARWDLDRENPMPRGTDDFDLWLESFKDRPR